MKIFISVDMEGICGVTHPAQCRPSHPDYPRFRRLMTGEVNAAIEGVLAASSAEFVVNDSHFTMTNILIEELHPSAALVSGSNKLLCQVEGLDSSFDGVFLVGYHQGDGQGDGIIGHTVMSSAIRSVRVNGELVDEARLNSLVAGDFGVPVALLTGDDCVCAAALEWAPEIEVAEVKRATDRLSGQHLSVSSARDTVRQRAAAAAEKLASGDLAHATCERPVRIDVEFRSTSAAHMCTLFPGVERTGPCEITLQHETAVGAYQLFWGLGIFAMAVQDGAFGLGL